MYIKLVNLIWAILLTWLSCYVTLSWDRLPSCGLPMQSSTIALPHFLISGILDWLQISLVTNKNIDSGQDRPREFSERISGYFGHQGEGERNKLGNGLEQMLFWKPGRQEIGEKFVRRNLVSAPWDELTQAFVGAPYSVQYSNSRKGASNWLTFIHILWETNNLLERYQRLLRKRKENKSNY